MRRKKRDNVAMKQCSASPFRSCLALVSVILTSATVAPVRAQGTQESEVLRGYGRVSAAFAPERARFTCESPEKAEWLQGKLLADLLWDATTEQRTGQAVPLNGSSAVVYEVPPYGAMIVGRLGNEVIAVGGTDHSDVLRRAGQEPLFRNPACRFKPDKTYPSYLDFFDLRAVKIYTHAMASTHGEGLESHWSFLQQLGFGGIAYNLGGGMLTGKSPAPGILSTADTDFEVGNAERNNGMILPTLSVGGALPLWAANAFPQSVMQLSPLGVADGESKLRELESYGMPLSEREQTGLWSLRKIISRYNDSPSVGGWQIYDGPGGIEIVADYLACVDFSESGLKSYREYLKDARKFDIKTVGMRYYGDPQHYKSWDEVMPLDTNGYFGQFDESCLLLSNWQWHHAAPAAAPPPDGDAGWVSVTVPGSDALHALPAGDAFYRIRFDATAFLTKNAAAQAVYLVCGKILDNKSSLQVWLNGQDLGAQPAPTRIASFRSPFVKLTGLLKSGQNELLVRVPRGRFVSPFFLTPHLPEEYPSSSKTLNSHYVDTRDWQFDLLVGKHRDAFTLARQLDPNRSLMLPAAGGWEMAGEMAAFAHNLGVTLQNTGRDAFYQPWWPRLGRVAGFYGASEPSETVHADATKPGLNRLLGWILIDGDSSHILFWDIEDYIKEERDTHWFSKNQRLVSLVGKSLPDAPSIVIFRSETTMRYSPEHYNSSPWSWDLGRGELNAAHYNWGYASEREVRLGLPPTCKVLVDAGSEVMDQATVDAITAFVSKGGTFVALHNTGRHTPIEANAWPITQLTGCRETDGKPGGQIRFEPKRTGLFQDWAGRTFPAKSGSAAESIRLQPQSNDVQVLARWDDGQAAVTSRTLGKGRVLCLGSTFWRDAHDQNGVFTLGEGDSGFLGRLFTDLGVERNSDASSSDIWLGDYTAKSGRERWVIAFNTASAARTVNIAFRAPSRPLEVRDVLSGKSIPFDYSDGWIKLSRQAFDNMETRVFAIKRADLVGGLPFWWGEKITYWKSPALPKPAEIATDTAQQGALQIDTWKFLADRDTAVSSQPAWNAVSFDDSAWKSVTTGPWNFQSSDLKRYSGTGLYRTSFTVPREWNGSTIYLNLYSTNAPYVMGDAEFFVNGKRIQDTRFDQEITQNARGYAPRIAINPFLTAGRNALSVQIKGSKPWGGENLSGFGGAVYLSAESPLHATVDLTKDWTCVAQNDSPTTVSTPIGSVQGKYLAKEFAVPASWSGHDVRLRLETDSAWLKGVLVNGKLLVAPGFRGLGRFVEWNVASLIKPGERARIELWGDALPLYGASDKTAAESKLDLISARIGCLN